MPVSWKRCAHNWKRIATWKITAHMELDEYVCTLCGMHARSTETVSGTASSAPDSTDDPPERAA